MFQLLDIFLHAASVDHVETFIKQQGFHLVAAQLHGHATGHVEGHVTTRDLVEACFTMLHGKPLSLEDE